MKYGNEVNDKLMTFDWTTEFKIEWAAVLRSLKSSKYGSNLANFIDQIYTSGEEIYPSRESLFRPFRRCSIKETKIVVIDNRPVRDSRSSGIGRGICDSEFDVKNYPKELKHLIDNIYETIYGNQIPSNNFDNSMFEYADQGMLFLNASMCVGKDKEYTIIWKQFMRYIIEAINERKSNVVYLFLTSDNADLYDLIDEDSNKIIVNHTEVLMPYSTVFAEIDEYMGAHYTNDNLIIW